MKITIDIPDEEIREEVKSYVGRKLAERLYAEYANREQNGFRRDVREIARETLRAEIRDNLDAYAQKAVDAAADSIVRKANVLMVQKEG